MIDLHADWFTITGRGRVASVNLQEVPGCPSRINTEAEIPVKVGQHVRIDGDEYEIRDIEYTRAMIWPPFIKPDVGLVVRAVDPTVIGVERMT